MDVRRRWLLAGAVLVVGAAISLAVACGDDNDNGGGGDNTPAPTQMNETPSETDMHAETPGETMAANEVHVYEKEYQLTGKDGAAITNPPAGSVTFEAHNEGQLQHSFYIIKTDLDEASLPMDGDVVDENADGVEVVDEIEAIDAGSSEVLSTDLEDGTYVLICNLPGHYSQGMHATLDVM